MMVLSCTTDFRVRLGPQVGNGSLHLSCSHVFCAHYSVRRYSWPLYRWSNWGSVRFNHLHNIIQFLSGWAGILRPTPQPILLPSYLAAWESNDSLGLVKKLTPGEEKLVAQGHPGPSDKSLKLKLDSSLDSTHPSTELGSCGPKALFPALVTPFPPWSHPGLYEAETDQEPLSLDKAELTIGNSVLQINVFW